jgi:hypothetical protein
MHVGPQRDRVLAFGQLTRDQAAALIDVAAADSRAAARESTREVGRVKFKLAGKIDGWSGSASATSFMSSATCMDFGPCLAERLAAALARGHAQERNDDATRSDRMVVRARTRLRPSANVLGFDHVKSGARSRPSNS